MNHDIVQMFREKLDSLTISDYYGLDSPGLTCYLNSVLQVLFMTQDFREAVKRCCSEDSTSMDTVLEKLFADLQQNLAKTNHVIKKLGISNIYEQRDAAEYFEKILCLTSPEAAKIFKGELNHKIRCHGCNEKNDSKSFFWILPLAVEDLPRQTYSVEKGLKAFFKGEKVCGEDKMFCNHCNEKQDADFGCEITHSPETLTLLLKRFSYDYKRRCFVKLHCNVDVPQTLHVKNCKYKLYAVVNHFGNLSGGHYTAHIKSFETDVWYDFNDDIVNRVKQSVFGAGDKSLKSHTAYLLMYRKVSRHPETTYESNQEAPCAHSDVKAELRHGKAERGEPAVPHQLKDESCIIGKNLMPLNGDVIYDWREQTNLSGELDTQSNQEAACGRQRKEMLKTDTGADRDNLQRQTSKCAKLQKDGGLKHHEPIRQQRSTNSEEHMRHLYTKRTPTAAFKTHPLDYMFEQNHTSPNDRLKSNETVSVVAKTGTNETFKPAETETVKHKREAGVGANVCDSDVKSLYVSSNGRSSSSAQYSTGHFQGQCRKNEPTWCSCSPNLCRKSNGSKRDKEKMQHAVTAESCYKPETKQTVKKGEIPASPRESLRKRKTAVESRDKAKQEPWR